MTKKIAGSKNKKPDRRKKSGTIALLTKDLLLNNLSSPIFVYHHVHKRFLYVNNDFAEMIGLKVNDCYNNGPEVFLSLIEPHDNTLLRSSIKKKLFDHIDKLVNKKIFRLCYSVNYRFKVDSHYDNVLQQVTAVEWDKKKYPVVTFNMLTNVSSRQKDSKMILSLNVFDSKNQLWKNVLTEEFLRKPSMLTEREQEIMIMLLKNFTASKIAEKLGISYFTARAHMRNILKKTECKSKDMLYKLAVKEGWV